MADSSAVASPNPPKNGPLDKVARAADRAGQAAKNFVTDDRHTAENKVLFCVTEQHVRDALKLLGAAAALTVLVGAGVTWGPRIRVGHLVERRLPVRHMRCAQPQRRAEGVAEDLEEGTKTTARRWGRKARDARDAAGDALDAAGDSLEYAARETTHKARSTAGGIKRLFGAGEAAIEGAAAGVADGVKGAARGAASATGAAVGAVEDAAKGAARGASGAALAGKHATEETALKAKHRTKEAATKLNDRWDEATNEASDAVGRHRDRARWAAEEAGRAQDKAGHRQWEGRLEAGDRAEEAQVKAAHAAERKGGCSIM